MAYLKVNLEGAEKTFPLDKAVISLGRDKKNDICILHESISRFHAKLEARDDNTFLLRDLKSTNGTKYRNRFIGTAIIRDGDLIMFGQVPAYLVINSLTQEVITKIEGLLPAASNAATRGVVVQHTTELPSYKIEILLEIAKAFYSVLDLTNLLNVVIDIALRVMRAERGFIMLYDSQAGRLVPKIARKMLADIDSQARTTFSTSIAQRVFEEAQAILTTDACGDARFTASQSVVDYNIRSVICVPLKTRGCVLGVLYVDNQHSVVRFGEGDLTFLEILAGQAAIAIENARLYEKISSQKRQIEEIVNGMADGVIVADQNYDITLLNPAAREIFQYREGAPNPKLRIILNDIKAMGCDYTQDIVLMKPERLVLSNKVTFLRDSQDQPLGVIMALRNVSESKKRERLRAQFLSFLAHKLIEPITKLEQLFLQARQAEPPPSFWETGYSELTFCHELAIKLLYFSELCAGPLRLSRGNCDLAAIVQEVLQELEHELQSRNLQVQTSLPASPCTIWIDVQRIRQAIHNLFLNAVQVTPPGSCLGYKLEQDKNTVLLDIWDQGADCGALDFSKMIPQDLFIEDLINTGTEKGERSIIRIAFIHHIMEAHGGNLRFHTDPTCGRNTFTLVFRRQAQFDNHEPS